MPRSLCTRAGCGLSSMRRGRETNKAECFGRKSQQRQARAVPAAAVRSNGAAAWLKTARLERLNRCSTMVRSERLNRFRFESSGSSAAAADARRGEAKRGETEARRGDASPRSRGAAGRERCEARLASSRFRLASVSLRSLRGGETMRGEASPPARPAEARRGEASPIFGTSVRLERLTRCGKMVRPERLIRCTAAVRLERLTRLRLTGSTRAAHPLQQNGSPRAAYPL